MVTVSQAPADLASWFGLGLNEVPEHVALRIGPREWTYLELHEEALKVAAAIVGAAPDGGPGPVGILAGRTIGCYAGILGASYAGTAFVPLSPAFPVQRTAEMVRRAGVRIVIAGGQAGPSLAALVAECPDLVIVAEDAALHQASGSAGPVIARTKPLAGPLTASPADDAYILFTSGSTGRPKGVRITHQNMASFLGVAQERYQLGPGDACSQTFDCTFDLAMFDLFVTWAAGATLVSTPPQVFVALPEFLRRQAITFWFSVPSAITMARRRGALRPGSLGGLRWSLFCGEPLVLADARDWQEAAPRSAVQNLYGPTELTIACTSFELTKDFADSQSVNALVPIGKPYPGLSALVVGADGEPSGSEGELCVTGSQASPGYLDAADDGDRYFVKEGKRWYRTGDLVRYLPDGNLAYLRRVDHQVKIRGYRVELAEVEARIRAVAGVEHAICVAVGQPPSLRLSAWFTGDEEAAGAIAARLRAELPEFMVPHWIRHIAELPLNSNKKVDRTELARRAQAAADDQREGVQ
jgi:amino acid adenylation domain-containing protein